MWNARRCVLFMAYLRETQALMLFKRHDIKQLDDQEVLKRFRSNGDMRCIEEIYKRYSHLIFGVCLKYLRSRENAKDATLAVFEKLIVELKRHEITSLPFWLHTVTKNHCLRVLKLEQRIDTTELTPQREGKAMNEDEWQEQQDLEMELTALESALQHLSGGQGICIRLFYLEQRSYQEISESTGFSLNEVKSHIQNGKRNLRLMLKRTA